MTTPDNALIDGQERLRKYLDRLEQANSSYSKDVIHSFSLGTPTEASLHASDIRVALDRIASLEAEKARLENEVREQCILHGAASEREVARMTQNQRMHERIAELEAQLSQAQPAPDGWKLVPIRPTDEMIAAAHESDREYSQRAFGGAMHMPQGGEDHWSAMLAASPTPPARKECWCESCDTEAHAGMRTKMALCPTCGNKRCPRSTHHDNACTNSNAPGQPGSSWEHVKPHGIQGELK